ncbi:hypothetical protein P691DRAFT_733903 [Macrolepiota fuliginosa MF-IS2]|uniref:Uncharacterized protein n=1 Tax=Macrolepiota fuliginosa MF-IS2 TaxID=1400762 RepID=A0A9P5X9X5_9AGAR|nr:hypothetical protein P691DRAFT_733903 [Macrolepiota fuliginosa MF-IS2]
MVPPRRTLCSVILWSSVVIFNLLHSVGAQTTSKAPFELILTPIHTVAFVFTFIFGLFFALQALTAAGKLGNADKLLPSGRRGAIYFTGRIYPFPLFLATISLIVYYVLSAITIVFTLNESKADLRVLSLHFAAGRNVALQLTHWFIVCTLLVLLFERERFNWEKESKPIYMFKLGFDLALLVISLSIIIALNSLDSVFLTLNTKQREDVVHLGPVYVAFNAILTVDVVASTFWTWFRLKARSVPDSIMIGQVVKFISPMLLIQMVYEIVQYAISHSHILTTGAHTVDALLLSRILVTGFTNAFIVWVAL